MTSNKKTILKAIYEQGGMENHVSQQADCRKTGRRRSVCVRDAARLQQDGLIEYRAYHGSRLTPAGLRACIHVVRSPPAVGGFSDALSGLYLARGS